MYIDGIIWFKYKILTSLSLIFLLIQFILIVDSAKPENLSTSRQMCSKLQSMLSYGKYQTSQISSNITYTSRLYAQNFLAYSSIDDILIFIEPKHQINVYNTQNIQLLINISTTDVVIATSTTSLSSDIHQDLYFIYETNSKTNLISLRVCQVHFNIFNLTFENNLCIETIIIQYDQPDLRINGLTIKRDHAGTKKSLLFISTDIGLIYTIFDTYTGLIIGESTILNETLNEGSIVLSSSGSIYYASKQENMIYELHIARDFRLRYGKIIKTNAIKHPFGLIADECNHLYIASRSMILIMYVQTRATIRSVFSIASDLSITLERLNSTTYVYATVRKNSGRMTTRWMFNFLYFTEPERATPATRHPAVTWEEKLDFNNTAADNATISILWPVSYPLLTINATKKYIQFSSTARKSSYRFKKKFSKQTRRNNSIDQDITSIDENEFFISSSPGEESASDIPGDSEFINPDENIDINDNTQFGYEEPINQSFDPYSFPRNPSESDIPIDDPQKNSKERENLTLNEESRSTTSFIEQSSDAYLLSKHLNSTLKPPFNRTIDIEEILFSEDDIQSYLQGQGNLTSSQTAQIKAYLAKQSSTDYNIFSKYSTSTNKPNEKFISDDRLPSETENEENLSINEDIHLQDDKSKRPLSGSKLLNRTININGTIFSEDDILSYLEGRGNFSSNQVALIQAYLAQQSSSDYNMFSKYSRTTNKPRGIFRPDDNSPSETENEENLSIDEDNRLQDHKSKRPLSDSKLLNRTININGTIFSEDDILSYLEGRANFSSNQEAQIQTYLAQQLSSNHSLFSKYLTSTKKPTGIFVSDNNISSNHTIDIAGTTFSDEDLQSYLQGRSNLSRSQVAQIEAYLANQSSLDYNLFSKFWTTTKRPIRTLVSDGHILSKFQEQKNIPPSPDSQFQSYVTENTSSNSNSVNQTIDIGELLFSENDVQSYLEGKGNLTSSQKIQIRDYLAKQLSSNYTIFSRYSKSTKPITRVYVSHDNIEPKPQDDYNWSQNYSTKQPLSDSDLYSERFDHMIDPNKILISEDDLKSYLEGRANLSLTREAQIQAYLAKQSSLPFSLFSWYSTSTKKPRRTLMPGHTRQPKFQKQENLSSIDDIQSEDYSEELLSSDPKSYNRTTDSEELLFSADDLRSYLEGRANLSLTREARIQAYLAKQSSPYYNLFLWYSTSTKKPRRTLMPGHTRQPKFQRHGNLSSTDDIQSEDYSEELLSSDPKSYNRTTDSEELLFSDDDLRSYFQGRANLSLAQTAQIQAYLAKQSSPYYNLFSKYTTTTKKPRRTLIPGRTRQPKSQRQGNLSATDDTQSEDYSDEVLSSDLQYYNRTTDSEEILFSEDDLRSYLEGRANMSKSQEAQIQAYLAKQSLFNHSLFSKYSKSTKLPTKIYTSDDNLHPDYRSENILSQNYLTKTPLFDSTYFNFFNDSEETLFSENDLQSYLEGRANLSLAQEAQIQAFLAKQTSLDNNTLAKYFRRTRKPTKILASDDKWQIYSEEKTNLSLSEQRLTSTTPYTTRKRIGRRRPSQSAVNGSDGFDDSIEQLSDIYADSKDDNSTLLANNTVSLNTTLDYTNNNNIKDGIRHKHSSPLSVDINVSSTLHPSSPFSLSSTTSLPSHRSRLSSPLHRLRSSSGTKSPKSTRFSLSKFFSETIPTTSVSSEITSIDSKPTTMLSYSTMFSFSTSKLQSSQKSSAMPTTDATITSYTPKQKSVTTLPTISSSPFTTHRSRFKSTITSTSLLTTDEQYTSKSPESHIETSSLPYAQSTRISTTPVPSTNFDSFSTIIPDKSTSRPAMTITNEEDLVLSDDNRPLKTTEMLPIASTLSPSLTDQYQKELITTQSSFPLASTIFPHFYKPKIPSTLKHTTFDRAHSSPESTLPIMRRTSYPSTTSTMTTTTERRHRTRKQKITRWQTQQLSLTTTSSSTVTTIIFEYQTISVHDYKATTSTEIPIWHLDWNPLTQQEQAVIKPSLIKNDSNTLITNDLLNKMFNNISSSTNSTSERSIVFNLMNLPPSSWNLSLNSTESIFLDVTLPSPISPSYPNTTTNLTFTNIEANRFITNINGIPINLHVDRVQTKQFSLTMDSTDNAMNRNGKISHSSDVVIGHVKSEQFELNLTKSDNMHVRVRQVDSATAELYLDSNFCTNESSLEINLNLSKNGTIRYGNRKPLHIGPVFTRVLMLKQSCNREQPLTLFFDICERQNPCSNGGTCLSVMPDYDDISYTYTETGHIGYRCECPIHMSGEHCQHSQYPLGYCLNAGTLFQIYDIYNKSIENCICPIGFHGKHCEENIDNCIGVDCSHHGMCEDGVETYKCSCFDGFYGFHCERTNVQTVLLQAASRSFGIIAILLIIGIAGLVVASDIHTYTTRKQQRNSLLNRLPRVTSELFENTVLLLGFSDAPIEMNDLSNAGRRKKLVTSKQRHIKRTTRYRRQGGYRQLPRRRPLTTFPKSSSPRYFVSSQSNQTIL